MPGRVLYTECHSQLWLDVASRLASTAGLVPVYWVGKRQFEPQVRERFPQAVFHGRTAAIRGQPAPAFRDMPLRALDAAFLARFSRVLLTAGKMMDRLDPGDAFRTEERMRLFHVQARYWRTMLDTVRPDLAVFPVQPHTLYDYIIYELCQAQGIRTCMLQWTLFPDLVYPLDHIDCGYRELESVYTQLRAQDRTSWTLSPRADAYLMRAAGSYEKAIPPYLLRVMPGDLKGELFGSVVGTRGHAPDASGGIAASDRPRTGPAAATHRRRSPEKRLRDAAVRFRRTWGRVRKRATHVSATVRAGLRPRTIRRALGQVSKWPRRARKAAWAFYKRWFRHVVRALWYGDVDRPLKERNRPMHGSFAGRLGAVRLLTYRVRGEFQRRQLLRYYQVRCSEVDFGRPFVFVALHYQPEQTTCPTGGVFMDQFLMVDMLSRCVPAGWHVYVKEHPFQFFPMGVGERGRTIDLYDDMLALANVSLVPWSVSPFDLIDGAKAVATVTGTTGLEAVMRGKPVLTFGYAWYRSCPGVFYTPTADSCRGALRDIDGGYSVDADGVRAFLAATERVCERVDLGFGEKIERIPHDENVAAVARLILRRCGGLDTGVPGVGAPAVQQSDTVASQSTGVIQQRAPRLPRQ